MQKAFYYLRLSFLSLLGALCFAGVHTPIVSAHWADLAVADIMVENTTAQMTLTIPTTLVTFADENGNGQISMSEFETHQRELENIFRDRISLNNNNSESAKLTLQNVLDKSAQPSQSSEIHSTFLLQYSWSEPLQNLSIDYDFFPSETLTPQCLATISQGGTTHNFVFTPESTIFTLTEQSPWQQQFGSFLKLGIEHIFTGYDHILFLIALLLPGGKLPKLLKIITAFTIAHSLTLSLAVLNIITLPTALVESLIALSIVYVAVENLWRKQFRHRGWITFAFGLVHGLGFANILRELTGSQGNLVLSLASFNLGVELGQIAIVLIAFLWLQVLHKYTWFITFRRGVCFAMILIGSIWFTERAISAM